jgi:hypothetical protein
MPLLAGWFNVRCGCNLTGWNSVSVDDLGLHQDRVKVQRPVGIRIKTERLKKEVECTKEGTIACVMCYKDLVDVH